MANEGIPVLQCPKCSKFYIPAKYSCAACGNTELQEVKVNSRTSIFTFITVRVPPEVYKDQAPYSLAVVNFEEIPGLMVTARVTCPENSELAIGKEVVFTGKDEIGYWFKLVS
jgi:uncharacterized OB-fold protein